jgi:hypothetical protein
MPPWLRERLPYLVLASVTIGVGLAVHRGGNVFSPALRDVLGDTLWAAMIFWWTGAAMPAASLRARAFGALLFAYAIELSQLYHAPALDALRRTTLGHLVLGSDFDGRDLAAYALGVGAAAFLNWAFARRAAASASRP